MSGDDDNEQPPKWFVGLVRFLKIWAIVAGVWLMVAEIVLQRTEIVLQRTEIKKLQAALEACESCKQYHEQETNQ